MAETYCGKQCAACAYRERLACPGCKAGPDDAPAACVIAQCSVEKGHADCGTCGFSADCARLSKRNSVPQQRLEAQRAQAERQAQLRQKADFLGKWLWPLFWLMIPAELAGLLTNQSVLDYVPGLFWPGQILNLLCLAAYGGLLLKLSVADARYRTAGICRLISGGVGAAVTLFFGGDSPSWALLITLQALVIALIGTYSEYRAHARAVLEADAALSELWERLWKWNIAMLAGALGGAFSMLWVPLFGLLVYSAASIGMAVVEILKLVYLYRSAKLFRR